MWSVPPAEPPPQDTLPGVLLERLDEVGHRLVRGGGGNDDHLPLARQARDRRHHAEVDRRLLEDDAADHHHAGDHQRVRIALGGVDELREPDRAGGAALVVELDAAHELGALHRRGELAPGLVPAAAGVGRDHHLQAGLGGGNAGDGERTDHDQNAAGGNRHGALLRVLAGGHSTAAHFPMQKRAKISPSRSSAVNSPVIAPSAVLREAQLLGEELRRSELTGCRRRAARRRGGARRGGARAR